MAEMIYAGEFATESERRAAGILASLPDDWIVVCNKTLATHGRTSEIDFIIIGHRLVFLLDEKSWTGDILGSDQCWVLPRGNSVNSPINKVEYVARPLAGHLKARIPSLQSSYLVHAGILLTGASTLPRVNDPRVTLQVFLGSTVNARLMALDANQRTSMSTQQRGAIRTSLFDLSNRPKIPAQISDFMIIEAETSPTGVQMFRATLHGSPRLLMMYDITNTASRTENLEFYNREFKALQSLNTTKVVAEVKDPFTWSEDFQILPIVPPEGTSLTALPPPDSSGELVDELMRLRICFETLHIIHTHKVIHRALTPAAIVIQGSGNTQKAIFTNFYAARVDEQSIALKLDLLALTDPYAHPTLAVSYGRANPATDQYSLALIFLERISRRSVTDLRRNPRDLPNLYARWSGAPQQVIEELTDLFSSLLNGDVEKPRDARTVAGIIGDLAARLKSNDQPADVILDQRYKVQRLLGKGSTAQTYLVTDISYPGTDPVAVKQFYNAADVLQYAQNEFNALTSVNTKYFARVHDIYPPEKQVHVKMKYIPGQTLEELQSEFPWSLDRWWRLADHLLAALEELENHRLLHRDVKPANIIFDGDQDRFVLIDFGFAVGHTETGLPAGTPLYWPPEAMNMSSSPLSTDRYALALILFRALTGALPFVGTNKTSLVMPLMADPRSQRIAVVLTHALSPNPIERPQTAEIFRVQLMVALRTDEGTEEGTTLLQPQINSWVDLVRGLMRTSASGNGDNRGLDSQFVRETYVPTALDIKVLPSILDHRPKVVFLSGNPGDGKTAFLEQVQNHLKSLGAEAIVNNHSGWEYRFKSHTFRSCYDASESYNGQSADEQLVAKLAGLEGRHLPDVALTVLVAINDGRLVDFLDRYTGTFGAIKQQVNTSRVRGTVPTDPIWLIDLKQRAFVTLTSTNDATIAHQVLTKLVDPVHWTICTQCNAQAVCPITANARALRESQTAQQLEHMLLIAHLRRQRHITMRDLRSTLALLITGNHVCEDIHLTLDTGNHLNTFQALPFWQSVFTTTDGSDELLGDLALLDPARQPQPGLDRFLHYHQKPQDTIRRHLFRDNHDLDRTHFTNEQQWIGAVKRRLYFASSEQQSATDGIPTINASRLLPYRYAGHYIAMLNGTLKERDIRIAIARGLLRSDGLPRSSSEQKLSLRVAFSEQHQLAIIKQFPLDDFLVEVPQAHRGTMIEVIPELLIFRHRTGTPRLELPLELFELLMRLAHGADPASEEYKPLLEELVPFKSALLLREANELVLVESQRQSYTIVQDDIRLVLQPHEGSAL